MRSRRCWPRSTRWPRTSRMGRVANDMRARFHSVRTRWNPGFMAFRRRGRGDAVVTPGGGWGSCRDIQVVGQYPGFPWRLAAYEDAGRAGRWGFTRIDRRAGPDGGDCQGRAYPAALDR